MIYNVEMDWEKETHSFEFHTGGSRLESLDFLGDFIGSLQNLYQTAVEFEDKGFPKRFKVNGGQCFTSVSAKKR